VLNNFKWYRKLRAGEWHLITINPVPGLGEIWINRKPSQFETALESEYYLECDRLSSLSDGYHTFDELYTHRCLLFIALANASPMLRPWKSNLHGDGSKIEGYFIAGITLPSGAITYHIPHECWGLLRVPVLSRSPKWDGHSSQDVINRLRIAIEETVVEKMRGPKM
jgi:hypothetical protein